MQLTIVCMIVAIDNIVFQLLEACQVANGSEVTRLLSDPDLDVNQCTSNGSNVLILSCGWGHTEIVKLLLSHPNIDVARTDQDGWQAIHWAAKDGYPDILDLLLAQGADVNAQSNNYSALACCCGYVSAAETNVPDKRQHDYLGCTRLLLEKGAEVDSLDDEGWTPLHILSYQGNDADMVECLLTAGADINALTEMGATSLGLACYNEKTEIVQTLLKHKADSSVRQGGYTALHWATISDKQDIVHLMLRCGVDINQKTELGETTLYLASRIGNISSLKVLLSWGADVNMPRDNGFTPLLIATVNDKPNCVEALVKSGANLNTKSEMTGATALNVAASSGHDACLKILIDAGADLNGKNDGGGTALYMACENDHQACLDLLIEAKADLEIRTANSITAIAYVSWDGKLGLLQALLKAGANMNVKSSSGSTPVCLASETGQADCLEALCKAGAKLDVVVRDGCTGIWIAAENGHNKCVDILLKYGADANVISTDTKSTPLMIAAKNGNPQTIQSLINVCDKEAKNKFGITALGYAAMNGQSDCLKLFLKAGADPLVRDNDNEQPLDYAIKGNFDKCTAILRDWLAANSPSVSLEPLSNTQNPASDPLPHVHEKGILENQRWKSSDETGKDDKRGCKTKSVAKRFLQGLKLSGKL